LELQWTIFTQKPVSFYLRDFSGHKGVLSPYMKQTENVCVCWGSYNAQKNLSTNKEKELAGKLSFPWMGQSFFCLRQGLII
jgi:hypothetical protein